MKAKEIIRDTKREKFKKIRHEEGLTKQLKQYKEKQKNK